MRRREKLAVALKVTTHPRARFAARESSPRETLAVEHLATVLEEERFAVVDSS